MTEATSIAATQPAAESDAAARQAMASALTDGALDTLAAVLRSNGRFSFELDEDDYDEFRAACERWARHVLTGASSSAESPEDDVSDQEEGARHWSGVQLFYRERRRAEQEYVQGRFSAFRGIIFEFVDGLRKLGRTRSSAGTSIESSLETLEAALEDGKLERVREALSLAVGDIRTALEQQRSDFDSQLTRMSERLDVMREDLLIARREMETDALTRAYNRGAFDNALERYVALATLSGQPLVLMMVDLDHFKRINDNYGHLAGDRVLAQAADCINRCFLRRNDFVARYGGEEFGVILFDTDPQHSPRLAQALLGAMRELEVDMDGQPLGVTCSIGYAVLEIGEAPEQLLARADAALYRAKAQGRDRYEGS